MRSSQAAVDLVVANEVGSKSQYTRQYEGPEWPGGASGVTVGIGYDLGYATREKIASDFGPYLPGAMIIAMQNVAGLTGSHAQAALPTVRGKVRVPWDVAMKVFEEVDFPRYENMLVRACPGADRMSPDCFGSIASIVYNRGAGGFNSRDDRFREMRAIKAAIAANDYRGIPAQIRSMKRLWEGKGLPGLITRREQEAKLFEVGLQSAPVPPWLTPTAPATPQGNPGGLNVQPNRDPRYDAVLEAVQKKLDDMHYHEVGDIDGVFGGKSRAAIAAFMNDRGRLTDGTLTPDVVAEVNKATMEGWSRPIAPSRANATAKDIAAKVPSVNQTWWQKLWATVLGVPTAAASVFKFIFGDQSTPSDYVEPVKNFFAAIPPELYIGVVAVICGIIFLQAKRAQDATVASYREGKIN